MPEESTTEDWTRSLDLVNRLTSRQLEVFLLLGRGMSNRSIALALVVSEHTVKAHIAKILKELEVESRLQAGLAAQLYLLGLRERRPGVAGVP
ncbi:helix-turn-helix transcriptional regulator [Spirillospora sp. NPDC029432]|uniref:helix-turn-helix domain-containing protein n=1 Tax=Spirillospora sp. NPDC029432 TaxID=3154599 RepID=UPI003451C860